MKATRMNAPDATPAAPKPAMARPIIKDMLLGETADGTVSIPPPFEPSETLTTDKTSQLEDKHGCQVRPFQGIILEELAPCRRE